MKIKQVVVVEGVTDTIKLKKIFGNDNVDTIETNGLALSKNTLNFISDVNNVRGVIILTDPDGPGLKIRDTINTYLNFKCFNAFINKRRIINSKKIGIAEAQEEDIKDALNNLITFETENESITWKEFLYNDFFESDARKKIAKKYNWSEKINSKRLFKWLNLMNLNVEDIKKIIGE
ncbi:primase-like protein [Spiroplasma diminutum CUAS-1]|uniref:Ribonuclease M5 n=2 Tax=Spiroplasma diminutum TaxID=216936 RepID=S5M3B2_9MOLU|nr:ribonuclease M5 [Spiroplasma diminutum]AGR42547.1 primase-like protein [Spiroplasma diminutum CUAS-1]